MKSLVFRVADWYNGLVSFVRDYAQGHDAEKIQISTNQSILDLTFLLPSAAGLVRISVFTLAHFLASMSSCEQQKCVESIFSKLLEWMTDSCTPVDLISRSVVTWVVK